MRKMSLSVRDICFISLFAAIIAVVSQLSIPMPYGVPMTMQTFIIPLAGVILGAKKGAVSVLVYVLVGAVGLPVFAGFSGGVGIIVGIRGGFIISFPVMAITAGIGMGKNNILWLVSWLAAGAVINFACGMLWFSIVMPADLTTAFIACVLPFIPTCIVKIILLTVMAKPVKRALVNTGRQ
ncbi:MAG: biotin transporter BioY [Firmicutes bacterium]|nr:biotin transporter BioY [Bacillota bacterium]